MWLLHAGPDLLGHRHARRGEEGLAEPGQRAGRRPSRAERRGGSRADERQSLSLLRLSEHRRRYPRSCRGGFVKAFEYSRADSPEAAVGAAAAARTRFIAGGTNLLDLM